MLTTISNRNPQPNSPKTPPKSPEIDVRFEVPQQRESFLETPKEQWESFLKVRGSLDGEETVYHFDGTVYANIPGQKTERVADFEGFNVARLERQPDGHYTLLTREVGIYRDPESHEIMDKWHNPYNDKDVDVVSVWNDPVNQQFPDPDTTTTPFPYKDLGEKKLCFYQDYNLFYPNPLADSKYERYSSGKDYKGSELFQFFVDKKDLKDTENPSADAAISWTRVGPWLPWMEMGTAPGELLYQARGQKLEGGVDDLPQDFKQYVEERHPEFLHAPESHYGPNETSWTYFKKQLDAQGGQS